MSDDIRNSKTIIKNDPTFPEYLDFTKLRAEGIEYLGKLAGKIWTDHNVHDPGITILEMLCYSLLDLGYRTNLPQEDIFTRDPNDPSKENNFFTPAQILTCNPLTIIDYRKLLIDIEGVRNAWLELAKEPDICHYDPQGERYGPDKCETFLNGLYHVIIDLEKDIDRDFEVKTEAETYKNDIIDKVKKALMAHRNLCEDFVDIFILCKQPIGVCAEIELEENADAEKVYQSLVENLRNFFTPTPRYYTLEQLLDNNKPIEDIFAGRPHNIQESHGFIDTDELEQLKLKKEIHLSDVYNVILSVPGVKSVQLLGLQLCDENSPTIRQWKYQIKKHHVLEFSPDCSGFRFLKHGIPVKVDFKKFENLFKLNFSGSGKVLYQMPSPYLDAEIPKGIYRGDLGHYYSIQNEFPRVYGIEEGGLPDNATNLRKAQALQLKGYLLFYDQLLANYLTQLTNIRSLFELSSSEDEELQRTYFINQLNTVPELQKLLRFHSGQVSGIADQGNTLVTPVDKTKLLALIETDQLKTLNIEEINCEPDVAKPLTLYFFDYMSELEIAENQLKNDLYFDNFYCEFVTAADGNVFYYIVTSSEDIALISKKSFKNIIEAKQNAATVKYVGVFDENYRSFIENGEKYSFTIDLNLASFTKYLQLIVEDRKLYLERRQDFLQHLLSRFAETFTDYALISYGSFNKEKMAKMKIKATERFLTHYNDISANRGRGYDYHVNKWNNHNISGFEKRVMALTGMENWKRASLCNFVVDKYSNQYEVSFKITDKAHFSISHKFDSKEEAMQAAHRLFHILSDRLNYQIRHVSLEQGYTISIFENNNELAAYRKIYATEEETNNAIGRLQKTFSGNEVSSEDVLISRYIYFLRLDDPTGNLTRTSIKSYETEEKALSAVNQLNKGINDTKKWRTEEGIDQPGNLIKVPFETGKAIFVDKNAFKIDINNTIVGKPDKFTYDALDKNNNFKLRPIQEFDNREQAQDHWDKLLTWIGNPEQYRIRQISETGRYNLYVINLDVEEAVCDIGFISEEEAVKTRDIIISIVKAHLYQLHIQKKPYRWRFNYHLGTEPEDIYTFESTDEYESKEDALASAEVLNNSVSDLKLQKEKEEIMLVPLTTNERVSVRLVHPTDRDKHAKENEIEELITEQKEIIRLLRRSEPGDFQASVDLDSLSRQGLFVYRLIDKDRVPARYSESFQTSNDAHVAKKALSKVICHDYDYPEICFGDDIIVERKESNKSKWYHYQIKVRNRFYQSGEELILFESVKGYTAKDEAMQAFADTYLEIIHQASDVSNYGKKISSDEKFIHNSDACGTAESIVFIPKATLQEMGGYDQESFKALAALAGSYPIRRVEKHDDQLAKLFPCLEKPERKRERECKSEGEEYAYYFKIAVPGQIEDHYWISVKYYDSVDEAWKEFRFFLMLLCYPGNIFVDCDPCDVERKSFRVYIREIMAESARRYNTEQEAWGEKGVHRFICVSQTKNAFHLYQRKADGCHAFFVACADSLIYHPCKYETSKKRDETIDRLYQAISYQQKVQSYQLFQEKNETILRDGDGEPFAWLTYNDQEYNCDSLLRFLGKASRRELEYSFNDIGVIYVQDNETRIAAYAKEGADHDQWKKTLELFSAYYPIQINKNKESRKDEYCIEIKLSGFNTYAIDATEDKPCGCDSPSEVPDPRCYVAWKSRCCFENCKEAHDALDKAIQLLLRYENYQSLSDCSCYEFGISLNYNYSDEYNRSIVKSRGYSLRDSEIIAVNPQCYQHTDMVCEATERAWKLINGEGLHVVEHILLRPRCREDCECRQYRETCENTTNCEFKWTDPTDDPCEVQPDVCFTPGADRYSFIATIALPAWPLKFRSPDNRKILENILYREAPAHVLLRILWLSPYEFCCFESKYKDWGRWLAGISTCYDFSTCDFMKFLFDRNYECMPECDECLPCKQDDAQSDLCFKEEADRTEPKKGYLDQINELFCWQMQHCDDFNFVPCRKEDIVIEAESPSGYSSVAYVVGTSPGEGKTTIAKPEVISTEPQPAQRAKPKSRSKYNAINSRLFRYRDEVNRSMEQSANHPLVNKTHLFLQDPEPSPERTSNILTEIIENYQTQTETSLDETVVQGLLKNILHYYLDIICFGSKDMEKIKNLSETLEKLRQKGINMGEIYRSWHLEEVKKYEPEIDANLIANILSQAN